MFQQVLLCAVAMPFMVSADDTYYTGESISYAHEKFSAGNCNIMYDPGVGNYYAALNGDQWDSTLNCGRCAEVSSDDTTSTVTVYIVDKCDECEDEGLGLSPMVFMQLPQNANTSIKWKFVDCPVSGSIEYCTNSLSKDSWLAVQPANSVTGVASMKINNQSATVADSGYYFVLNDTSNMSAVNIELTSISGETIAEKLSLTAGNCTVGTSNFQGGSSQLSDVNNVFDTLKGSSSDGGYKAGKVTPPDDTEETTTRSEATSSGTSPLFIVPALLIVVGGIAMAVVVKKRRRKWLTSQSTPRKAHSVHLAPPCSSKRPSPRFKPALHQLEAVL